MLSGLNLNPEDIDVVILCGGLGTRLRSVLDNRPKVMADINGRPFLDILIKHVSSYGFRRFILCVGYMKEVIKVYYGEKKNNFSVLFSEEEELLGTAGAVKKAEKLLKSNPFLVLNGDSFCKVNLRYFLDFHFLKKALMSVALVHAGKDSGYGFVTTGNDNHISSFNEKIKSAAAGFINAGIYLFDRDVLKLIPKETVYSLEYDLLPGIIHRDIYGYISEERLFDIGTPERYAIAVRFLSKNK